MRNKENLKLNGLCKAQFKKEFTNQWTPEDLLSAFYCKEHNTLILVTWDGISACKYYLRNFIKGEDNKMDFSEWELDTML